MNWLCNVAVVVRPDYIGITRTYRYKCYKKLGIYATQICSKRTGYAPLVYICRNARRVRWKETWIQTIKLHGQMTGVVSVLAIESGLSSEPTESLGPHILPLLGLVLSHL